MRNKIALRILDHWGYHSITVGDLDGRNFKADQEKYKNKNWYRPRDKSYKTEQAVMHAYRLADIAIQALKESL